MAQQWKSQTAGMKVEVHLKVNKHIFYILSECVELLLLSTWCSKSAVADSSNSVNAWKILNWPVLKVPDGCCEGWSGIKGEQMKVLHSVQVYLSGYCFRCCAWSVQFQSHLTILVLMEDPQLTNIKSAGQCINLVTLCYYHSTTSWLL